MKKVGLTGGIGSGKSTVGRVFEVLGIPVFSADDVAKGFLLDEPVKAQIRRLFGEGVIRPGGEVDKAALAAIIFNDAAALRQINDLIHPLLKQAFVSWAAAQKAPFVLMEAAILFENGFDSVTDKNIVVTAPQSLRLARAAARDGVAEQKISERMANQWPEEELTKRADYVVDNSGRQLLLPQIITLHDIIATD